MRTRAQIVADYRYPGEITRYLDGADMAITLNHTIVPARDNDSAARVFARIVGLSVDGRSDHFAPVRINDTLTLLFDNDSSSFKSHHYAFHVSDAEFDASLRRIQEAELAYVSALGLSAMASSTIGMTAGASTSRLLTVTLELMTTPP